MPRDCMICNMLIHDWSFLYDFFINDGRYSKQMSHLTSVEEWNSVRIRHSRRRSIFTEWPRWVFLPKAMNLMSSEKKGKRNLIDWNYFQKGCTQSTVHNNSTQINKYFLFHNNHHLGDVALLIGEQTVLTTRVRLNNIQGQHNSQRHSQFCGFYCRS